MKRFIIPVLLVACMVAVTSNALAKDKSSKEGASTYLVISPHTPEECMKTLDDVSAMGKDVLKEYSWGCASGDHTGYIMVKAANEQEALAKVPASVRDKAKAMKVDKLTADQIKALHEKMDKKM